MQISDYYDLPLEQRFKNYINLIDSSYKLRKEKVSRFLKKYGDLPPDKQLEKLIPSISWEDSDSRIGLKIDDHISYEVNGKILDKLFGNFFTETNGKLICLDDQLLAKDLEYLDGTIAICAIVKDEFYRRYMLEHERAHAVYYDLPNCNRHRKLCEKYNKILVKEDDFNSPEEHVNILLDLDKSRFLNEATAILYASGICKNDGGYSKSFLDKVRGEIASLLYGEIPPKIAELKETYKDNKELVKKVEQYINNAYIFPNILIAFAMDLNIDKNLSVLLALSEGLQIVDFHEINTGELEKVTKMILDYRSEVTNSMIYPY